MDLLATSTVERGWKRVVLALLLLTSMPLPLPQLRGQEPAAGREYALKAVFLYNFCQFIDWPPRRFGTHKSPIIIGILGSNPFGNLLTETVQGEAVRGRPIHVEFYQSPAQAKNWHLLFISDAEFARHPAACATLRGHGVVTVGESDDFLNQGGMIALASEQNRIRVRIYLEPVSAANVEISSKLLRIADIKR